MARKFLAATHKRLYALPSHLQPPERLETTARQDKGGTRGDAVTLMGEPMMREARVSDFFFLFIQCGLFIGIYGLKEIPLMETSYLKAHPFWNRYPKWMPISTQTVVSIRTRALVDLKAPRAQTIPLYLLLLNA